MRGISCDVCVPWRLRWVVGVCALADAAGGGCALWGGSLAPAAVPWSNNNVVLPWTVSGGCKLPGQTVWLEGEADGRRLCRPATVCVHDLILTVPLGSILSIS